MSVTIIFFLMLLMHIIDDFVLQPKSLTHLKQKTWWKYECESKQIKYEPYKNDYIAALVIHGLSWSIMVHLPIIFFMSYPISDITLIGTIICSAILHAFIDNIKANKFLINLIEDQTLHIFQLISIIMVFV